jgi:ribosomal protein S18 acetylase RimI-like enzyme
MIGGDALRRERLKGLHGGVLVRPMVEEDVEAVVAMAAVVPTAPHWPLPEYYRMLRVIAQDPKRRGAWVAAAGGTQAAALAGFAMANHIAGEAELEAVVTTPMWRRCGVGQSLVQAVAGWGRACGAARLILEARASNVDALALYRRIGANTIATRMKTRCCLASASA